MSKKNEQSEQSAAEEAPAKSTLSPEDLAQIGMAVGMGVASALKPAEKVPAAELKAKRAKRCYVCRQREIACKGQHRMAVVYPTNDAVVDLWPGLRLNGVKYDSGSTSNPIAIPADWDMENQLSSWVQQEVINLKGRKKVRNAGHVNVATGEIHRHPNYAI